MFGVTTYSGDRMTVRAAQDANGYEDELARSQAERQDFIAESNRNLRRQGRVVDECRAEADAAEAALNEAKDRLHAREQALSSIEFEEGSLLRRAERERERRRRIERGDALASAEARSAGDGASAARERRGRTKARLAALHAMATRLHEVLEAIAPGHPLLQPTGLTYPDGKVQTALDLVDDLAHDVVATRRGVPTRASQFPERAA